MSRKGKLCSVMLCVSWRAGWNAELLLVLPQFILQSWASCTRVLQFCTVWLLDTFLLRSLSSGSATTGADTGQESVVDLKNGNKMTVNTMNDHKITEK